MKMLNLKPHNECRPRSSSTLRARKATPDLLKQKPKHKEENKKAEDSAIVAKKFINYLNKTDVTPQKDKTPHSECKEKQEILSYTLKNDAIALSGNKEKVKQSITEKAKLHNENIDNAIIRAIKSNTKSMYQKKSKENVNTIVM
jgi:hypothetical protein